jgi:hypothetical protein
MNRGSSCIIQSSKTNASGSQSEKKEMETKTRDSAGSPKRKVKGE